MNPSQPAKTRPTFYLVGCGNVGTLLTHALLDGGWALLGAMNRGAPRRRAFAHTFGIDVSTCPDPRLRLAKVVLVAVSDTALPMVGAQLLRSGFLTPRSVVAHTSGAWPGDRLGLVPHAASLHPALAITAAPSHRGCDLRFAIEGDRYAQARLRKLVGALGGQAFVIKKRDKARYHAGCVLATNLAVALWHVASDVLKSCDVPSADQVALALAHSAWRSVQDLGLAKGLTGPAKRGDLETISRHLDALPQAVGPIYRHLTQHAWDLAHHPKASNQAVRRLLGLAASSPRPKRSPCRPARR